MFPGFYWGVVMVLCVVLAAHLAAAQVPVDPPASSGLYGETVEGVVPCLWPFALSHPAPSKEAFGSLSKVK